MLRKLIKIKKIFDFESIIKYLPVELQERLEKLKSNPERLDYHPEGNTYDHIKIVVERLLKTYDSDLIMAGIFHDLGKLETTKPNPKTGQPSAFGHERKSAKLVLEHSDFIERMGANVDNVYEIVNYHMRIKQMSQMGKKKQDELRVLPTFTKLEIFSRADSMLEEFKFDENCLT